MNWSNLSRLLIGLSIFLLLLGGCSKSNPEVKTIIVTSSADNGSGTLHQALLSAQSGDTIKFDPDVFLPKEPVTIELLSSLPLITQGNLTIDASNAGVILDGTKIQESSGNGLIITSNGNTILGLQIVRFPGSGIALQSGAKNNTIGGDRYIGTGLLGQGNLVSANKGGGIAIINASYNTIVNNYVGTDVKGTTAWGNVCGISLNNASYNQITGNLVSGNDPGYGIELFSNGTHHNTIKGNFIGTDVSGENALGNKSAGIAVHSGANHNTIGPDNVIAFNQSEMFVRYSDSPDNAIIRKLVTLQEGNSHPEVGIFSENYSEFADNRIQAIASDMLSMRNASQFIDEISAHRITRYKWTANEGEERSLLATGTINIDWSESEFDVPSDPGGPDDFATLLAENGIISTYMLTFWDKANHPEGWQPQPGFSRFSTEEDIQRYLEYVRFVVRHFKGRITYYEIWNEPEMGLQLQQIEVADYINLVKRTVPVIRQEDPEAKIVVGGLVIQELRSREYLFNILRSDIMPLVDVVSWHPMFSVSPEYMSEYYYEYPLLVQEIKDIASTYGFQGEYRGEELTYRSPDCPWCYSGDYLYSNIVSAKYTARGIVTHLGMDLATGISGMASGRIELFATIRNLCTVMAGARPTNISLGIQSEATNIKTYNFYLPDGSQLIALWTDGIAVDDDPGVKTSVTIHDVSVQKVMGIDVLNGFEQSLIFSTEDNNLIIRDLLIRDYPIFLRLIH